MTDPRAQQRSELACPVCGAHQLAIDTPPHIDIIGVQPYSDLIGMGDFQVREPPAIVCLACGTTWPDREAFERARKSG
jgi:hypothetical protein